MIDLYRPKDTIVATTLREEIYKTMGALEEALADYNSINDSFYSPGSKIDDEEIPGWVVLACQVLTENREALEKLGFETE